MSLVSGGNGAAIEVQQGLAKGMFFEWFGNLVKKDVGVVDQGLVSRMSDQMNTYGRLGGIGEIIGKCQIGAVHSAGSHEVARYDQVVGWVGCAYHDVRRS